MPVSADETSRTAAAFTHWEEAACTPPVIAIFRSRNTRQAKSSIVAPGSGVGNARELGGYAAEDGRMVKQGVLLRTAKLADATEEDVERLLSVYHLAVDVDFRGDGEVEKAPDPQMEGVEYLNIHILED